VCGSERFDQATLPAIAIEPYTVRRRAIWSSVTSPDLSRTSFGVTDVEVLFNRAVMQGHHRLVFEVGQ
jgi:hypothetical protein